MKIINKRQLALFHGAITEFLLSNTHSENKNPLDLANDIEAKSLYDIFCLDPSESSIYHKYLAALCGTNDVAFAMGDPGEFMQTYCDDIADICRIIRARTKEYGEIYVSIALSQETVSDVIYFFIGNITKE